MIHVDRIDRKGKKIIINKNQKSKIKKEEEEEEEEERHEEHMWQF